MDRPISFYLLRKDELMYEVEIRDGKPDGTVEALRRQVVELAKHIPSDDIVETGRDPDEELSVIRTKLDEIAKSFSSGVPPYKTFNRLRAVAHHVYHRLGRVMVDDPSSTSEIEANLNSLLSRIDSLFHSFKVSFETPPVAPEPEIRVADCCSDRLISRLNHKFSGSTCIRSYLERLDELCHSRRISPGQLYTAAAELFEGVALVWYRSVRGSVRDWASLREKLIDEFLPVDYDRRLLKEIQERTQGKEESASHYIALMLNYFNRLSRPIPDDEKLYIVRYNLRPNYILALSLEQVSSLEELKLKCRMLESQMSRSSQYRDPPKVTSSTLAPDLGYHVSSDASCPKVAEVKRREFCRRCRVSGHSLDTCESTEIVCFSCGEKGTVRSKCPKCVPSPSALPKNE